MNKLSKPFFFMSLVILLILPATANALSLGQFEIHGFLDLEYEKSDHPSLGDTKGSFDQYHFNLLMQFPVSETLSVKGHIEFEHAPELSSKSDKGEIKVEWAYFEYLLNNSMKLRGGMVLTPFGIYNEIHDATPTYTSIRIPWGIYRSDKVGGDAIFPKFSTGINLLGDLYMTEDLNINYVVYVANGENTVNNAAEKDDNSNKAVGGRLMISPLTGLMAGGSYYTGKKGVSGFDHSAWIGSLDITWFPMNIRAEYASSKLDKQTQKGWYGEVSYRVRMVTPFLRYGTFDPDDDVKDDEWTETVYGINYEIQPNFILKLENRHFSGSPNNSKIDDDYNEYGAAVTVAF